MRCKSLIIFLTFTILLTTGKQRLNAYNVPLNQQSSSKENAATLEDSAAWFNTQANNFLIQSMTDSASWDSAIQYYHKAIALDSTEAGYKLNMGLAHLIINDTLTAEFYFMSGIAQSDSSIEKVYSLLNLDLKDEGEKASPGLVTGSYLKQIIESSSKKLKKEHPSKPGAPKTIKKAKAGGPKSVKPEEIQKYLFWKYED